MCRSWTRRASATPGDAVGCLIPPGRFLYPAAAPPEVDLAAWERSLDAIEARAPTALRVTHYGEIEAPAAHVARTRARLRDWAGWIERGLPETEFVARVEALLRDEAGDTLDLYRQLPGFDLTYAGIKRYFDQRATD